MYVYFLGDPKHADFRLGYVQSFEEAEELITKFYQEGENAGADEPKGDFYINSTHMWVKRADRCDYDGVAMSTHLKERCLYADRFWP